MKITKLALAGLLIATTQTTLASDALLAEARQNTKAFGMALKGEVVKSMKSGGPVSTIGLCNDLAPKLTQQHAQQSGWDMGRTSLKIRNPNNAPDSWELAVLNTFETRKANGESPKTMDFGEVVEVNGEKTYRYMKAIPTGKPCLHCHAAEIKPAVAKTIENLYPDDKARGYKAGDIRGAFTLSKKL